VPRNVCIENSNLTTLFTSKHLPTQLTIFIYFHFSLFQRLELGKFYNETDLALLIRSSIYPQIFYHKTFNYSSRCLLEKLVRFEAKMCVILELICFYCSEAGCGDHLKSKHHVVSSDIHDVFGGVCQQRDNSGLWQRQTFSFNGCE
jgi:hypothetical protein